MFGLSTNELLLLPAAIAFVGLGIYLMHRWPILGAVGWLITIAFVPFWIRAPVVDFIQPAALVGILVLISVRPLARIFGAADLLVVFFFVACAAPLLYGGASQSTLVGALGQWLVAFLVGRLLPEATGLERIYSATAVVFSVVAVFTIIEFVAGWNPFVGLGPSTPLHQKWGVLQIRGDLVRAEGAFGHSIALGCSLALALPIILAAPLRSGLRIAMAILVAAATVCTISRVSILAAVLGLVLSVIFLRRVIPVSVRAAVGTAMAAGAVMLAPYLVDIFTEAGAEAANSASYRGDLTELLPDISLIGIASSAHRSATGDLYFGRFQSIDSQLIYTGLTYGWVTLACGLLLLAGALWVLLAGRATVPTVAVVAQIPALATVALITQYSMMFWFVCGLSIYSQINHFERLAPSRVNLDTHPSPSPFQAESVGIRTSDKNFSARFRAPRE